MMKNIKRTLPNNAVIINDSCHNYIKIIYPSTTISALTLLVGRASGL